MKYGVILCILLLTSCSKSLFTTKKPDEKITVSIAKDTPSLIFFSTLKENNQEHEKIYQRFYTAFGDTREFPIKSISGNEIVEYLNKLNKYFKTAKIKEGLLISDGKNAPIVVYNPKNYIKAYEKYFDIIFNDKTYYQKEVNQLKVDDRNYAEEILKSKFKITQDYADKLIKNSSSAHYNIVKKKKSACNTNTVYINRYKDSLKTKKEKFVSYSHYNEKHQYDKEVLTDNKKYYDESNYFYNNFGLLDSIIRRTTSDGEKQKSKSIYIYLKKEYFILDVDKDDITINYQYLLNKKLQCIKSKSYNHSGTEISQTLYKYDHYGRLTEEIQETSKSIYSYEKPESDIYSKCKNINKDKSIGSINTIYTKNGYQYFVNEYEGKVNSYSKILLDKNNCTQLVYTYDKNKNFTSLLEYVYK